MKRVVAVSGGVDSVVLLDILSRGSDQLIVAHVEHGIRGEDSRADARFVEALARTYQLPYVETHLNLGPQASEELARTARYEFLFRQAETFGAEIVTAHHRDDVLGTIAINVQRGTGWRGVAVMSRAGVTRPLLGWSKRQIYEYALEHRLEWVEDSTNQSADYLRNRLRGPLRQLDESTQRKLIVLRQRQLQLRHDIDRELGRVIEQFGDRRYPYIQIDASIARELLKFRFSLTYSAAERLLHAIKTARAGTTHHIATTLTIHLDRERFIVEAYPE